MATGTGPVTEATRRARTQLEDALQAATGDVQQRLTGVGRGDLTVEEPLLRIDRQPPEVTIRSPHGFLELRVDQDTDRASLHLISPGFPEHGIPGPIDTPLNVAVAASVINVPEDDLDHAVRLAGQLVADGQREMNQARDRIERDNDLMTVTRDGVISLEPATAEQDGIDAPGAIGTEPSTAYAAMAQRNANLAIGQAVSTPTLADDADASAARMTALGARGAVSQGTGSLDPHQATQVAIAASATTRQRLREVHDMVDQVAAQRATVRAGQPSRTTAGTTAVAPRYADRTDYVSPTTGTDSPTIGQG